MRKFIVLFAVVAIAVWSGASLAQNKNSNGIGYFACQVPDYYLPSMVIDAEDDDWLAWFPDVDYGIPGDQLSSTINNPPLTKEDWDAFIRVGWTAPGQGGEGVENMVYYFARVTDDVFDHDVTDPDHGYNDDDMESAHDFDNSGGPFPDRIQGQQWTFHVATEGYPHVIHLRCCLPPEMQWGAVPPYGFGEAKVYPEGSGHMAADVTLQYEIKLAGWDMYRPEGPDASDRHMLTAGETLNMGVQFNEADESFKDQIGTCPDNTGGNGGNASVLSQFTFLDLQMWEYDGPTAVESSSWGTIKSLFR
jgi:hypothetical protein